MDLDTYVTHSLKDEEVDAADPDKRGNMKLMDQGREADNEFEEGKSVSSISDVILPNTFLFNAESTL